MEKTLKDIKIDMVYLEKSSVENVAQALKEDITIMAKINI